MRYDSYITSKNRRTSKHHALLVNSVVKNGGNLEYKRGTIRIGTDRHKCGNKRYRVPASNYDFSMIHGEVCHNGRQVFMIWKKVQGISQSNLIRV